MTKVIHKLAWRAAATAIVICTSCSSPDANEEYPGFTRHSGNVFLMENHCHSLVAWHMLGIEDATLIHIDTHDDCRPVSDQKIAQTAELLDSGSYGEIFLHTDTEQFLNLKKRDAELLYDLGNFIFPAMRLRLVSDVYWVVPQPVITAAERQRLARLMLKNLPGAELTQKRFPAGGFELEWEDHLFRVITFEDLPDMKPGGLLDLDIDVFAFPKAMTDDHLIAKVNRSPEEVFKYLDKKIPEPSAVTISASVWGGYLPLMLRFLPDAAYDFFTSGTFPQEANMLMTGYRSILIADTTLPEHPSNEVYLPASLHMHAMHALAAGNIGKSFDLMSSAAASKPIYRKGYLDAAEALIGMQEYVGAGKFIDEFERRQNGPTYNSLAVRSMLLSKAGKTELAVRRARKLVEWDSNPYTLLIFGSTLTAAGKTEEARTAFADLLVKAPNHASANYNLGLIEQRDGNSALAIDFYRKALTLEPDFSLAKENLAYLLLDLSNNEEAERLLRELLEYRPNSHLILNNLSLALMRQGKHASAVPLLQNGLQLVPNSYAIKINLIEALIETGEINKARVYCDQLLKEKPDAKVKSLRQKIENLKSN